MVLSLFSSKESASVPELIAKKKYAQAVTALRDQLKSRPDDSGLLIQLADVLALDNKVKQAVQILERAADQLTADGFTTKAVAALKRIERLDPGSAPSIKAKLDALVRPPEPKAAPPRSAPPPAQDMAIDIDLDDSEPLALDIGISAPEPVPAPAPAKPKAAAPPPPPEPEPEPVLVPEPEPVPDFMSAPEPPPPDFLSEPEPPAEPDFMSHATGEVPFVAFGDEEPEEPAAAVVEPDAEFVPEIVAEAEDVAAVEVEEVVLEPEPEVEEIAAVEEVEVVEPIVEIEDVALPPEPVYEPEPEPEPAPKPAAAPRKKAAAPPPPPPEDEEDEVPEGLDLDALLDAAVDAVEADAVESLDETEELEEEEEGAFASLSEDEMAAVLQGLDLLTYEPGDIIVSEGEPGDSMFVIASGSVKIFVRTASGASIKVRELYEGNFFGEIALLSGKPRSATITAGSRCELLELDRETLEEIAARHPRVKERVLEIFNKRANSAAEAMLRGIDEDEGGFEPAAAPAAPAPSPADTSPGYAGVELKDTALAMMRANQWTDASALWELYLGVSPDDSSARASLGLCMAKVGDWNGAIAAFEAATAANPSDASSFFSLAVAYSKVGKKAESKAALQKTLEADPNHAKAKAQLAKM